MDDGSAENVGAVFRNPIAAPYKQREYALNGAFEQARKLCCRGWRDGVKHGLTILDTVHAVEHQTVKVNVEVRRRAEALNQRDGAGVDFTARQCGFLYQVTRDHALHNLQRRAQ